MNYLIVIQLLGGVGLFLYAIKMISDSLQQAAGDKLRHLIGMLTKTPVLGVIVGTAVTVLIQSSSATTVMTVSFVDAGLMTLRQAIGAILGANIGTTVTGQILAFKIKDFALLFVIVGVLLLFLGRTDRQKQIGNGLLGFGLLFVGMQTMEHSMSFLRSRQDIFLMFASNPLLGVLAGAGLTLLVQSSSATVGLTIALGAQGLLPLEAAIPIVLGDNIGTTITAVLASFGTNRSARQACAAHVLFNIIGVCIFLPLMPLYLPFVAGTSDAVPHQIANAHTLFNVCNTLLFLPFVGPFARLIERIIPADKKQTAGAPADEAPLLDTRLIGHMPVAAVSAVEKTSLQVGLESAELLRNVQKAFFTKDTPSVEKTRDLATTISRQKKRISDYIEMLQAEGVSVGDLRVLRRNEVSVSDLGRIAHLALTMVETGEELRKNEMSFSEDTAKEVEHLFDDTSRALATAIMLMHHEGTLAFREQSILQVRELAAKVREREGKLRVDHIANLQSGKCSAQTSLVLIDVLSAIENIAYRARKISEVGYNAPVNA